jgi:N-alpha-acetyltransferase 35, NatC auxiliary subunit
VRRVLCHTITDWDNLQVEVRVESQVGGSGSYKGANLPPQAEEIDAHLRTLTLETPMLLHGDQPAYSYPLSSWVYHEKLRQLRLIIQLGFELEIYSPEELPGMYWYLSHLCSIHISHMDRIRTFVAAASARSATIPSMLPKVPNRTAESRSAFKRALARLDRHTKYLIAVDSLALALQALYVLLARLHLLPITRSSQAYSNARLRYELRMKPFIPILLPELVPFEAYEREAGLVGDSDNVVLDRARTTVSEARKAWESLLMDGAFLPAPHMRRGSDSSSTSAIEEDWRRDIKDSLRACIGASIAIGTVGKAISARSPSKAGESRDHVCLSKEGTPEFSPCLAVEIPQVCSKMRWHARWAVPRLSELNSGQ